MSLMAEPERTAMEALLRGRDIPGQRFFNTLKKVNAHAVSFGQEITEMTQSNGCVGRSSIGLTGNLSLFSSFIPTFQKENNITRKLPFYLKSKPYISCFSTTFYSEVVNPSTYNLPKTKHKIQLYIKILSPTFVHASLAFFVSSSSQVFHFTFLLPALPHHLLPCCGYHTLNHFVLLVSACFTSLPSMASLMAKSTSLLPPLWNYLPTQQCPFCSINSYHYAQSTTPLQIFSTIMVLDTTLFCLVPPETFQISLKTSFAVTTLPQNSTFCVLE